MPKRLRSLEPELLQAAPQQNDRNGGPAPTTGRRHRALVQRFRHRGARRDACALQLRDRAGQGSRKGVGVRLNSRLTSQASFLRKAPHDQPARRHGHQRRRRCTGCCAGSARRCACSLQISRSRRRSSIVSRKSSTRCSAMAARCSASARTDACCGSATGAHRCALAIGKMRCSSTGSTVHCPSSSRVPEMRPFLIARRIVVLFNPVAAAAAARL